MWKHVAFWLCIAATSLSYGEEVSESSDMGQKDKPHRLYVGVFTEHYVGDSPDFNEKNEIQFFKLNVRPHTELVDVVYLGKMVNSYYDEGLLAGVAWETELLDTPGLVLEYGLLATNSYRKDVIQTAPRVAGFVIAPSVGLSIDVLRLRDSTKDGITADIRVAPAAVNIGFSVPFG
jgi:hypothetical protein